MVAESEEEEGESLPIDCPVLVTERLVLRPPHPDDLDDLVRLANNRAIAGMLGRLPHPYTHAHGREFIAAARPGRHGGCRYALALADSGDFIGCAGLEWRESGLELGYWIGEPFQGRGYATEAAHALVDLAFRATGIEQLHASCRVINPASRRVIQKCGFQYVGQGMMHSVFAGKVPIERYVLDRRTWIALRSWPRT
jgi:RimJ/RimL family protein N-acetyltransferase